MSVISVKRFKHTARFIVHIRFHWTLNSQIELKFNESLKKKMALVGVAGGDDCGHFGPQRGLCDC
jgi:hypothetical protein